MLFIQNDTCQLVPYQPDIQFCLVCGFSRSVITLMGPLRVTKIIWLPQLWAAEDLDCHDTFSLVVKATTMHVIPSSTISQHWVICQLDVTNAFLSGSLTEYAHITQPLGFVYLTFQITSAN